MAYDLELQYNGVAHIRTEPPAPIHRGEKVGPKRNKNEQKKKGGREREGGRRRRKQESG